MLTHDGEGFAGRSDRRGLGARSRDVRNWGRTRTTSFRFRMAAPRSTWPMSSICAMPITRRRRPERLGHGVDPEDFIGPHDVESGVTNGAHSGQARHSSTQELMDALQGGGLMSALDDLTAAVAGQEEVGNRVAALVDGLQAQVADLQQAVADLQASTGADLQPLTDRINAITEALTTAEAPPAERSRAAQRSHRARRLTMRTGRRGQGQEARESQAQGQGQGQGETSQPRTRSAR